MQSLTLDQQKVLDLLKQTYCRIKPSAKGGVGIFAIRPIPAGTNPFVGCDSGEFQSISELMITQLDPAIQTMMRDFFVKDETDNFQVPTFGLNGINISFFLNHDDQPNVKTTDDGNHFVTIKDIKVGEELVSDYITYEPQFDKKIFSSTYREQD